ncbi:MAG: hypothetical protein ACRD68_16275, partial [Pyrinomonadaceae bacterium]
MFQHRRVARAFAFLLSALVLTGGAIPAAPTRAQQGSPAGPQARQQQRPAPSPSPRPQDDDTTLQDDDVLRVETDLTNVL